MDQFSPKSKTRPDKTKPADTLNNAELSAEIAGLRAQIEKLNRNLYVRVHNSYMGLFGYNLLRGLALGLGTVIGATILVSVAAYFLAQIDFIPIIGTWADEIAKQIQGNR